MPQLARLLPVLELRLYQVEGTAEILLYHQNCAIVLVLSQIVGNAEYSNQLLVESELIPVLYDLMRANHQIKIVAF